MQTCRERSPSESIQKRVLLWSHAYGLGRMPRGEVQKLVGDEFSMESHRLRGKFVKSFSWSLPCLEAVGAIRRHYRPPLHDALAGSGYWSIILNNNGVEAIPGDIHLPCKNRYHTKPPRRIRIKRRNLLRLAHDMRMGRIKGDILLSWPPYLSKAPSGLLRMIPGGTRIFYIGEDRGGCTAEDSFYDIMCEDFTKIHHEQLPNWPGVHDSLSVWEKK